MATWLASTAIATALAWIAVQGVTSQVSPPAALPLPQAPIATVPADPTLGAADPPDQGSSDESATEAYTLVGGVVTVRYLAGGSTELVQAAPSSGFLMDVHDGGPDKVEVRFRSDDHESRLVAQLRSGTPAPRIEERGR